LSTTLTPEDDEQYEDMHRNYEADQNARWMRTGEDLIWRTLERQSITSISVHEHLTFMKHIYVDMNDDVIVVRLRFAQQE
jgi:hypothetical protein